MGKKYIHIYFDVGVVVNFMPLIRSSERTGQVLYQHIRQTLLPF